MPTIRKNQIALQLFRSLQFLNEADAMQPVAQPQAQAQQTPQAVANSNPMQTLPGQSAQAQQAVGSSSGEPINTGGEPLSIDTMIDRLNVIRGGKSFNDPEVYGQLTTLYKGLSDQDKVSIDGILTSIGKVVVQQQGPAAASAGVGTPPQQPPAGKGGAAPAPTAAPTGAGAGGIGAGTGGSAGPVV